MAAVFRVSVNPIAVHNASAKGSASTANKLDPITTVASVQNNLEQNLPVMAALTKLNQPLK